MARTAANLSWGSVDFGKFPALEEVDGTPAEGPRFIRGVITLEAAIEFQLDLGVMLDTQIMTNVQAIKIDNSDGLNPVTIIATISRDRLIIPAGYIAIVPFAFSNDSSLTVLRADAGDLPIYLYNVPYPFCMWGARSGAAEAQPGTATKSNVAGLAADTLLLQPNAARRGATFFNDSAATLYLSLSPATSPASLTSYTVQLLPNAYYELPAPIYTGMVRGIWSAAVGNVRITELS